jgi:hypothetical protein
VATGFELEITGLLTPPLSSFGEEREKNQIASSPRIPASFVLASAPFTD